MENIIKNEINTAVKNILQTYDKNHKLLTSKFDELKEQNEILSDKLHKREQKINALQVELDKYKDSNDTIPDDMIMIPSDIVYATIRSILYAESIGVIDKISDKLIPYAMKSKKDKTTSEKLKQEKPVDSPSERLEKILNNSGLGENEMDLLNFLFSALLKDHK